MLEKLLTFWRHHFNCLYLSGKSIAINRVVPVNFLLLFLQNHLSKILSYLLIFKLQKEKKKTKEYYFI